MNTMNLARAISSCGGVGKLEMDGTSIPVCIEQIECINEWNIYDKRINFKGHVLDGSVRYGSVGLPPIKNVIFNNPATIVIWEDGSKTVVKAQNNDEFDLEKGLAMAITKKVLGNKGNYFETIKKWTEKYVSQEEIEDDIFSNARETFNKASSDLKKLAASLNNRRIPD